MEEPKVMNFPIPNYPRMNPEQSKTGFKNSNTISSIKDTKSTYSSTRLQKWSYWSWCYQTRRWIFQDQTIQGRVQDESRAIKTINHYWWKYHNQNIKAPTTTFKEKGIIKDESRNESTGPTINSYQNHWWIIHNWLGNQWTKKIWFFLLPLLSMHTVTSQFWRSEDHLNGSKLYQL